MRVYALSCLILVTLGACSDSARDAEGDASLVPGADDAGSLRDASGSLDASAAEDARTADVTRGDTGQALDARAESGAEDAARVDPGADAAVTACHLARRTFLNHGSEGFFACAASSDQRAQCWGEGFFSATPKQLTYKMGAELGSVLQFAAVGYNGCVLLETGAVHCWTSGDQSQVRPVPVIAADVVQLSGGYHDACALLRPKSAPASVSCWQVEQWTPPTPLQLEPDDDPIVVANGYKNGCVVLASGAIKCWGANNNGQLGSGPGADSSAPKTTASLGGKAIDVTVGNEHVCALLEGGAVKCWGQYNDGKLGFEATQNQSVPGQAAIASGAIAIAAGKWHTCALMQDRSLSCWGKGPIGAGALPTAVPGLGNVAAVSGGRDYACASLQSGALQCWGSGGAGALGKTTPTDVPDPAGGAFVAALQVGCPQ